MNIDRNNYEEYFLLYADNELTDSEKADVLIFVKNNKDLEQEFRMILGTIAKPDLNIQLGDKSFLHSKNESLFINLSNYEEIFVLYHDHELTAEQKNETEVFVSQHPELKEEFDLIGVARFTPDMSIAFYNKKSLYKKENTGRVIPIFWRVAAAAVFAGFILWVTGVYFKKTDQPLVHLNPAPGKISLPEVKKNAVPLNPVNTARKTSEAVANNSEKETNINKKPKRANISIKKNDDNIAIKNTAQQVPESNETASVVLPGKINGNISTGNQPVNMSPQINAVNTIMPVAPIQNVVNNGNSDNIPSIDNSVASNDNYVFYDVKADRFKKSKLGGFLKKVKRVVERTNPIAQLLTGDGHQLASK